MDTLLTNFNRNNRHWTALSTDLGVGGRRFYKAKCVYCDNEVYKRHDKFRHYVCDCVPGVSNHERKMFLAIKSVFGNEAKIDQQVRLGDHTVDFVVNDWLIIEVEGQQHYNPMAFTSVSDYEDKSSIERHCASQARQEAQRQLKHLLEGIVLRAPHTGSIEDYEFILEPYYLIDQSVSMLLKLK